MRKKSKMIGSLSHRENGYIYREYMPELVCRIGQRSVWWGLYEALKCVHVLSLSNLTGDQQVNP